ncbi:MAG: tRNA (adenosine(37)-N6)-threonylcarbamoyltransferase complex ATPase subunit type 1 TsaE [Rickettsiales bacterium]
MQQITLPLPSLGATRDLAERIAPQLRTGDVLMLAGDLGAGKTTFAQFLIHALSPVPVEVTSPTFTLLQTYPIRYGDGAAGELYHYDLYRIEHPSALAELGLEEATQHLTLIEWPERLGDARIQPTLALSFVLGHDANRSVTIHSYRDGIIL